MYVVTTTKNSLSRPQLHTKTLSVGAGEGRGEGAFYANIKVIYKAGETAMKSKPIILAVLSSVFAFSALAKSVSLYEQPQTTSKVVGTIDLSAGVIPISTPNGGEWVKVGDPHNGNVGWIKSSDLSAGTTSSFSFTQKVTNDGKAPQTYKIEFGNMPTINTQQAEDLIKSMQKSSQKMIQDMLNDTKPIIMPIVIIPNKK